MLFSIWCSQFGVLNLLFSIWAHPLGKVCFTLGGWLLPNFNKTNNPILFMCMFWKDGDSGMGDPDAMYSCIRKFGGVPLIGGPVVIFALPFYLFVITLIWMYTSCLVPCFLAIWAYRGTKLAPEKHTWR